MEVGNMFNEVSSFFTLTQYSHIRFADSYIINKTKTTTTTTTAIIIFFFYFPSPLYNDYLFILPVIFVTSSYSHFSDKK
jgi:hypothetical protein